MNILVVHGTVDGSLENVEYNPMKKSMLKELGFDYIALGHIHKAQKVGGREEVRYSGSPLPMSFSETNYRHQVVLVTLDGRTPASIEPLIIPQTVALIRVPKVPVPPALVLEALRALPDKPETDSACAFAPFLEVRVLLTEPAPGFRNEVEEVLANKFVRLVSIVPSYPKQAGNTEERVLSIHDLQQIDPLDMIKRTYESKYANALPESLERLFREVEHEVQVKQD